jgi:NAD(P)H-flavin reductase
MSARTLAPFGRRLASVRENRGYGPYCVIVCENSQGPKPQAGQFYMLANAKVWGGQEDARPFLPRAFSVMRANEEELCFLLEMVGPGTRLLAALQPGDQLALTGPLGVGFAHPIDGRRPILVGGGIGIAPLVIWQEQLLQPTTVLLGFRDGERAKSSVLLDQPQLASDDGSVGHHGLVTDLLAQRLASDAHATVYACGPPAMLEAVRAICAEHSVPAQLALETTMACGYGACFGCVVPTSGGYIRLCVDGPVVDAAKLDCVPAEFGGQH